MKDLLITFGCSWTEGVGVNYEPGMSFKEFKLHAKDQYSLDHYSFRNLLCNKYNLCNLNFARGGSSNQTQFRTAEDFFSSDVFQRLRYKHKKILVLWGITSIFRNETFFTDTNQMKSFFYTNKSLLSKTIVSNHFDSQNEMNLISKKIDFWNKFFDLVEIKNLWFDTFNHHNYHDCIPEQVREEYQKYAGGQWPSWQKFKSGDFTDTPVHIQEEILDYSQWNFYQYFGKCGPKRLYMENNCPRDLLSQLAIKHGMTNVDTQYHLSDWEVDSERITFLVKLGILNPYSHHPTKQGHVDIAEMLAPILS